MFFTRLAVAALSFGSIAQVFAAPIATGLGGNTADVSVPAVTVVEQTFTEVLALATARLVSVKAQAGMFLELLAPKTLRIDTSLDDITANPTEFVTGALTPIFDQIKPAMSLVGDKLASLKAHGIDKDEILLLEDGVAKTTPGVVASDVVGVVEIVQQLVVVIVDAAKITHLETPDLVKAHLVSIKTVLLHIHDGLKPTVVGTVRSVPSALIQAIQKTDDAMATL
ncbi:hypothetical protein BDV93DRAFT_579577 [Ceratobasidium sp. AG-I]|nr:hypothetical protein BDV93DRAFT_579577 [Ceratobasidium sp. AG-I]